MNARERIGKRIAEIRRQKRNIASPALGINWHCSRQYSSDRAWKVQYGNRHPFQDSASIEL